MAEKRQSETSLFEPNSKKSALSSDKSDTKCVYSTPVFEKGMYISCPNCKKDMILTDVNTSSTMVRCPFKECNHSIDSATYDFSYSKVAKENYELRLLIGKLKNDDIQAQEMTQKQIEKFQERTALSEEAKAHAQLREAILISLTKPFNTNQNGVNDILKYMHKDQKNIPKITIGSYYFTAVKVHVPGKPIMDSGVMLNELSGVDFRRVTNLEQLNSIVTKNTKGIIAESVNDKCDICDKNKAQHSHKADGYAEFPFQTCHKDHTDEKNKIIFSPSSTMTGRYINWGNEKIMNEQPTLCEDCIKKNDIKNTSFDLKKND